MVTFSNLHEVRSDVESADQTEIDSVDIKSHVQIFIYFHDVNIQKSIHSQS